MTFRGRLGIQQRVLPRYRVPFFDLLAEHCAGGLSVFAGEPLSGEAIPMADNLAKAKWERAKNIHFLSGAFYACYQRGLIKWLENFDPDALIVEANARYISTPAAVRWMHERKRPVIAWGLGAPPTHGLLANLRNAQRKSFLAQFDALIAYSQRGATEYNGLKLPPDRIFVAHNAVSRRPSGTPRSRPVSSDQPTTVLYVGRLQRRKRVDSLIRACAALQAAIQPHLLIVGEGPQRFQLETLAKKVYPNTEFRGALFGLELDKAYDDADLFVLPGTGGLAVQQALAHSLPIIVAEGDGSQEGMVTMQNGRRLPANDEPALIDALVYFLSEKTRLRKMGAESLRLAKDKFNLEEMVDAFVRALNKVAE